MHFQNSLPNSRNLQPHPRKKKINYNRVLCRPSPPLHLAGGVLLGRAYLCCNGEARWVEEFESYLPRLVFRFVVAGIEVAGVDGGGAARVTGGVEEQELGVVERRAHKHRESVRKLLGRCRARSSLDSAGPR